MKRALLAIVVLVLLSSAGGVGAVQKVSIMLDWVPNTNHTGLFVAQEKGFYKEAGIEVEIMEQSQGLSMEQLVASGRVDFGISSQEWATAAMAEGIPVVSVAAVIQHNTTAYASLKKAGINGARDFEGKTFASWGLPLERAMISDVVRSAGGNPSKLKELVIGTADLLAMLGRDVDIVWIFMGWQGIEAKLRGMELSAVMLRDVPGIPDYYTPIIITSKSYLAKQKQAGRAFIEATSRGYEYAVKNPEESAKMLIRRSPEINAKLAAESQAWLSPRYIDDAAQWGIQKASTWKGLYDWMVSHDLVKPGQSPESFFTNELLP
ncbi:MAG TPA: ABC transporter substrate-binding protein [Bacillota bacterium]|nr:ABC transporter substrate-binding protein [Bacillota bacterium]HOG53201.1 ABC transporter substrate-binding protein [Bacillota bacterium]